MNKKSKGYVVSVNISRKKGTIKTPVQKIDLVVGQGVRGDAHASPGDRQVSLLMMESIEKANSSLLTEEKKISKKRGVKLGPGSFAENITTSGLDLKSLKIGDKLRFSRGPLLRLSKIGKECPRPCAIYYQLGDCLMPTQGIFCEVLVGGPVQPGDEIEKD